MIKHHETVDGKLIVDEDRICNPRPGDRTIIKIAVKDLPECYERERLIILAQSPDNDVFVVARCGQILDWSAYIGWPKTLSEEGMRNDPTGFYRTRHSSAEGTAAYGDKISPATALELFPEWSRYSYRR